MHSKRAIPHTMSFHGHPGKSQPISLPDYFCLRDNPNLDSIHAYDANGEISSLYKNSLNLKNYKTFKCLLYESDDFITRLYDKIICNPFKKEFKKINKITNETERVAANDNLYQNIQESPDGQLRIHRFWQNYAKQLGVRYKTNYTGFPPKEVSLTERIINTFKNIFKSE